jgi:beta-galactosidase
VVERGGVLLLGPFSGVADIDAHIRLGRFPVPFADLVGGSGEEYSPLPDAVPVSSSMLGDFITTLWGERLRLDDGEAVATFGGGDLDGLPAVLRRRAPSGGEAWYVGIIPPAAVLAEIVGRCARAAGLVGVTGLVPAGGELPEGVEAVRRGDVLFLFNTTTAGRDVTLPNLYRDLLSGAETTGSVRLGPRDAVALIERTP